MQIELDIGCGVGSSDGFYGRGDLEATWRIGIDCEPNFIRQIKSLYPQISFIIADARKLPFKNGVVDAISATHMFEHVNGEDGCTVLHEIARVMKGRGQLRVATPTPRHERLMKIVAPEEYHLAQHHQRVILREELVSQIHNAGFEIESVRSKKGWLGLKNTARVVLNRLIFRFPMEEETTRLLPRNHMLRVLFKSINHAIYPMELVFLKAEDPTLTSPFYTRLLQPVGLLCHVLNNILPLENYVIARKK